MVTAIIQARMGSSRLPGKIMLDLLGRPVIWHVYNRASRAKLVDEAVIATTTEPEDDVVASFCEKNNIPFFRGSLEDVLDRFYRCAKARGAKDIVRITADCPLHDPDVIDQVVKEYMDCGYGYVTNTLEYTFPDGLDVEVFSFSALEDAWRNARLPSEREHVTPYIRKSDKYKKKNVCSKRKYPAYRLTLDQKEDYEMIKKAYQHFGRPDFSLDEVVDYLDQNPGIAAMNSGIGINEGYKKSLKEDVKYKSRDEYLRGTIIEGDRISLWPLQEKDASEEYCSWINDPETNRFLETKKTTVQELRSYIREKRNDPGCLFLGVFRKEDKRHIGNVKLEPIDKEKKEAVLGILIGDKGSGGQGYGTEAVNLAVDYAFKELGLMKIILGVVAENKAAIGCYRRAGFKMKEEKQVNRGGSSYRMVLMEKEKDGA